MPRFPKVAHMRCAIHEYRGSDARVNHFAAFLAAETIAESETPENVGIAVAKSQQFLDGSCRLTMLDGLLGGLIDS